MMWVEGGRTIEGKEGGAGKTHGKGMVRRLEGSV